MSKAGGDFRDAAARESIEMIGPEILVPPLELGVSLCHPCPNPPALWRPGLNSIAGLVLGFAGLGAGALIATLAGGEGSSPDDQVSGGVLIVALTCTLLGFVSLFGSIFLNRGWVRRRLGDRGNAGLPDNAAARPKRVDIEDPDTFQKLKMCSEDLGVIYLDPQRQAVLIEGLRYRYTIFHEDLIEINQVKGGNSLGVQMTYQVGRTRLSIVVGQQDNLLHEFRKQTIGVKNAPLIKDLQRTFGIVEDLED